MIQTYKSIVSEHELLGGSFQYMHLELFTPHRIEFLAGQYVIVTIEEAHGIRRNYSIASSPSMDHAIELLVDVKPQGEGSLYLASLSPGDEVEFAGPFGNFVVKADEQVTHGEKAATDLLFVATGSGISTIRSMILDQLMNKKNQNPIRLWWGMRYPEDCFWIEDFDQLEKEYPNFKWDLVLSKPPEAWPLHSGHVTPHLVRYVEQSGSPGGPGPRPFSFYLCGSQNMIVDVSTELEQAGINKAQIHYEKFF